MASQQDLTQGSVTPGSESHFPLLSEQGHLTWSPRVTLTDTTDVGQEGAYHSVYFPSLGSWKARVTEGPVLAVDASSGCAHTGGGSSFPALLKGTSPTVEASPPRIITSQGSHLHLPLHWGLGFVHEFRARAPSRACLWAPLGDPGPGTTSWAGVMPLRVLADRAWMGLRLPPADPPRAQR